MSRLPPIPPQDLNGEQKSLDEFLRNILGKASEDFEIQHPDGALIGPMAAYLHAPQPSRLFIDLLCSLMSNHALPISARETAILVVGTEYRAQYMIYSHERIAANNTNLTLEQIREIKQGVKPSGLGNEESVAYDVAVELVVKYERSPLSKEVWRRAVQVLGKEGAVILVHFVGFYAYTAILLNGFNVPIPEGVNEHVA